MGLDMYFTREPKNVSSKDSRRYSQEVGYFRKHNALHQWLVDNAQDGVDECQRIAVTPECLAKCFGLVQTACVLRDASLMPPTRGFFFGSTTVDELYWSKMIESYKTLQDILETTDFETENIYYQSSW